jgi:SAM-dependent methyltransferase
VAFTVNPFAGAARFYDRYRPGVPPEVGHILVQAANRDTSAATLLDVGTGTGQVIESLHAFFSDIIAVDPDGEMLALAEQKLSGRLARTTTVHFWRARIEEFEPPRAWRASLVTFCRSFHWIDQPRVLRHLARIVDAGGVIAVLSDRSLWEAGNDWQIATRDLIQSFLGRERRAGEGIFSVHGRSFEDILEESPFSSVEQHVIPIQRTWTFESILGYLYSTSFAAPSLFGERISQFEAELRELLTDLSPEDRFHEENEFTVLLARRPT